LFKFSLVPREKKFFVLFEQSAQNALKTARQLQDMLRDWENIRERVSVITALEHEGDAITHQIAAELHRTFVTPFDREDIAMLANSLDDITDFIHSAADAMSLYNVDRPTEKAKEMVDIAVQAIAEVGEAVSEIEGRIDKEKLLKRCVEINRLENVGDSLYRSAMAELFANCADFAHVIKWREIYEDIENAIDRCEDVANILEGVALKYA
jgi:predicted phosphate transport protein (TIGR00153 family)